MIAAPVNLTVRPLPPDEWHRLRDLPFAANGLPDPGTTVILVAETEDGRIVGLWAAMTQVFLDGLWTAPEYRKTTWVAYKLLRAMKDALQHLGVRRSFTLVQSVDVLCLASKAGFERVLGDLCVLEIPPTEGT